MEMEQESHENTPSGLHSNTYDFLRRVYGVDLHLVELDQPQAESVCLDLISSYWRGRSRRGENGAHVTADNAEIAEQYVQGTPLEEIRTDKDMPNKPLRERRIDLVPAWLYGQETQGRVDTSAILLRHISGNLAKRNVHRQLFFGTYGKQTERAVKSPLCDMAQEVKRIDSTRADLLRKIEIADSVGAILRYHDAAARGSELGEAAFAIIDPETYLPGIAAITTRVIYLSSESLKRQRLLPKSCSC